MASTITCPKCRTPIEITEVMSSQLREQLRGELEAELAPERQRLEQQMAALTKDKAALEKLRGEVDEQVKQKLATEREKLALVARKEAAEAMAVELQDREAQLREAGEKLKAAQERELSWRKKERELAEREETLRQEQEALAEQAKEQLAAERQKLIEEGRRKAAEELGTSVREREEELAELREKLKAANEQELAFRKRQRELEERAEQMQLEIDRQLDAERQQIRESVRQQADEEYELKLRDQQEKMDTMRKQIDELKRRSEQGSQQAQGESLELVLDGLLREAFPTDSIEEVPKGIRGADVLQRVISPGGADCGAILWETKRTKNWSAGWLPKLRDDQREAKATVAVLVTEAMPPGVLQFDLVDGVWVTNRACAVHVATAIRVGMLEVANARRALEGQHSKVEQVYNYLVSPQFRNRAEAIVEPLVTMEKELQQERRAYERAWSKREKQITRAMQGVMGLYGDFQGIIGASLPEIEGMSLPGGDDGDSRLLD